ILPSLLTYKHSNYIRCAKYPFNQAYFFSTLYLEIVSNLYYGITQTDSYKYHIFLSREPERLGPLPSQQPPYYGTVLTPTSYLPTRSEDCSRFIETFSLAGL